MKHAARPLTALAAATMLLGACGERPPGTPIVDRYDLVLHGGRVIDPETGLDAVRDVGIRDGRIAAVSETPLRGDETMDATGHVVAPGFIDLHSHTPTPLGQRYQALDGVTTALELEAGAYPVGALEAFVDGRPFINYGASVSHLAVRLLVKQGIEKPHLLSGIDFVASRPTFTEPLTAQELGELRDHLERGLRDGGLGIGLLFDYLRAAVGPEELDIVFAVAAEYRAPVFVHIRRGLPGDAAGLAEMIELARRHGTGLHVCHLNANAMSNVDGFLAMIDEARAAGVDVTTEAYPWNAGSTSISAAVFSRDWQSIFGISYEDVEWAETGERFDEKMWNEYREKYPGGTVIHHYGREEWTREAITAPGVMIASDAMPVTAPEDRVHPRGIGTFAKVLGDYAGDGEGRLPLAEALRKMTLLPAQRLASVAPAFTRKGRLQAGADADITVFDPTAVAAAASYRAPLRPSRGIAHVIVGGQFVVHDGELVEGAAHGVLIKGAVNSMTD